MIRVTGYLHQERFCDLIRRWMYNQPDPSDAELITQLVLFNNVYVSRYLKEFSEEVFRGLHGSSLKTSSTTLKSGLKDVIVANPHFRNVRIEELVRDYRDYRERFYRETPFEGTLFFLGRPEGYFYIGSNRIKRVRRLAEKSARRIIDSIFYAIKARAADLADDRARRLGISREELFTPAEDMKREFFRAEERLMEDLRAGNPISFGEELVINDVAGIKVIMEDRDYPQVKELLERIGGVIEEEPHKGIYNAINLIIRYRPDKDRILSHPLGDGMLRIITSRGLSSERAQQAFVDFVRQGEEEINIEVIVSNYQEMLESEIGRCMHEDRIARQRQQQEYRGHLAKNVEYLMVYLFNFAVSPQNTMSELPFQLWNRYLPDYFDEVVRGLFDIPPLRIAE